jgi:penicillin-binding protein 1C
MSLRAVTSGVRGVTLAGRARAGAGVLVLGAAALAVAVLARPYDVRRLAPEAASSLVLTDRTGEPLRTVPLPGGGRALWVPLDRIPSALVAATLAGEDARFREHVGVDPLAVGRALVLAATHGHAVSGASTLTMQLARLVAPHRHTLLGKLGEAVDALRIERACSKDMILEQYLNRAYYGRGAFGVEEAARRTFGKAAVALSDAEATLLAVLPRAPRRYDPLSAPDEALARRAHVLALMEARGWLDAPARARIEAEPLAFAGDDTSGARADSAPEAAHFTDWVLAGLPPEARARGGIVRTTLDLALQRRLVAAVRAHVTELRATAALDAGVVVLDPATGDVRAMVGSADYDARAGQTNIVTTRRHPGSALKPFIYALAMEGGATPSSLATDTLEGVPGYHPRKVMHEHGVASFRAALAGSYNIAAVGVLSRVGVPEALERMRRAGLGPLEGTAADYGLDLALGTPRVRLLDLAAAYGFLVNDGVVVAPRFLADGPASTRARVYSPEASWLTMDVLSDANARRATFGAELPLDLPFRVAAKTGTSSGFADTVTVGATREAIAAAWVGAFDGTGTKGKLAMWSAAPLVRAALLAVADLRGAPLTLPPTPARLAGQPVQVSSNVSMRPNTSLIVSLSGKSVTRK